MGGRGIFRDLAHHHGPFVQSEFFGVWFLLHVCLFFCIIYMMIQTVYFDLVTVTCRKLLGRLNVFQVNERR